MAATANWSEYNTAGATETANRAECDWKIIDNSTTAYNLSTIPHGTNSMTKYQALKMTGTWTALSGLTFQIDINGQNNSAAGAILIAGVVVAAYTTPTRTTTSDPPMSTIGLAANWVGATNPWGAGTDRYTAVAPVYSQALRTQMQTFPSTPTGVVGVRTIVAQWYEK